MFESFMFISIREFYVLVLALDTFICINVRNI